MASEAGWCVEFFREPKSGRCPALEFLDVVPDPVGEEMHPAVYKKVRLMWALYLRSDPRSVC